MAGTKAFYSYYIMLADWCDRNNEDETIIFVQYLLLFLFRFVQLLTKMFRPIWKMVLRARQADGLAIQAELYLQ